MKRGLRAELCKRVNVEYKQYLGELIDVDGSQLWHHRNRLYVYGCIQEYIQHSETMPGILIRCLSQHSNPLELVWTQYLQTDDCCVDTWGGIEAMLLRSIEDIIGSIKIRTQKLEGDMICQI